jgi:hypothetical protein
MAPDQSGQGADTEMSGSPLCRMWEIVDEDVGRGCDALTPGLLLPSEVIIGAKK